MRHPLPFRKTPLALAITASLASPILVQAAPGDPVGTEFQVNTYTLNNQSRPAVAMDAHGNFVVAWQSLGQDGSGYGIYAQRYNRAGVAQGPEFQVNTYTTGHQHFPAIAIDTDGDFVVVWTSDGQDGSYGGIYAQRYTQAGEAQGSEFRVNTFTTSDQRFPAVAMDADGDFVVVWQSEGSYLDPSGYYYDIYAQRYNRTGVAQGGEFRVPTTTFVSRRDPTVAMDADGDFVVAWASYEQGGGAEDDIYAQRYTQAGVPQGPELFVNAVTLQSEESPAVAMDDDGDFVVVWEGYYYDVVTGAPYTIFARRYDRAGVAQGTQFMVIPSGGLRPTVAMDDDGDFVVAWQSGNHFDYNIFARRYTQAGVPQGSEFRVNTSTTGHQEFPTVAMDADGNFVVAWQSDGQDGSGSGIYAQRYAGPAAGGTLTTVGLYAPTEGRFRLRTEHAGGRADYNFRFGPTDSHRLPVTGDWNGNGQVTIGLYDQQLGQFYLNDQLAWRNADHRFRLGPKPSDWIPIAGDWNGDGIATVGLYEPTHSKFFLRNSHTPGPADRAFRFGPGGFGWLPIAGDWDGDGRTTIGLYDPVTSRFYLRNRHAGGAADLSFRFGQGNQGQVPLAGDWDGDEIDTVGLYDPATSRFYLNNRHAGGAADLSFRFGRGGSGWLPVTGQWVEP